VSAPRTVAVWWRDDDAGRDDPRLAPLLEIAARHGVPVALAVVPAWLEAATRSRLLASREAVVWQHGWDHTDHSGGRGKPIELGGVRPVAATIDDLVRGRELLAGAFGERFAPVLVPPWNRIDERVRAALPAGLWTGLSRFGAERPGAAPPERNTQVDGILWRAGRRPLDLAAWERAIAAEIEAGRTLIGLLTHHREMDDAALAALDRLIAMLLQDSRVRWLDPGRWDGEDR
jgi:peptidoglycan/xylan/chitin deacetylase (PgdA/CDA1 family)